MASAEERKRCCFLWHIYNPFLPRGDGAELEASIYHERPFKVIFEPMDRRINYWKFAIKLAYNAMYDPPPDNVVARNLELTMHTDLRLVKRQRLPDHIFSNGNQYQQLLEETVVMGDIRVLSIRLEFEITPKINVVNYCYDYMTLRKLSKDVKKLLDEGENTDLIIWSADKHLSFNVHSYILDFRWPNLQRIHETKNENEHKIETNISDYLFNNIVNYMYSGDFPKILPFVSVPQYSTELCQVVDRYKLDHLYKVLVKDDLKQQRVTINQMYMDSRILPLRIFENRAMNNRLYSWTVRPNFRGQYELDFRIQVGNEAGNWLSYTLKSFCEATVYVEVYLEVVKKQEASTSRGTPETTYFPHDVRYQKMDRNGTMASGPVLFLGCPKTFGDSSGAEFSYFIKCCINISRGRSLQLLKSVDTMRLRDKKERYEMLSDHMHQLLDGRRKANMIFSSIPGKEMESRMIHKELFKIRVPQGWKQIFYAEESYIPDEAICSIDQYALPSLVEYIYTGRVHLIPAMSIDKIILFADQTAMFLFRNLIEVYIKQRMK